MDFLKKRKHKHGKMTGKKPKIRHNTGSLQDQILDVLEKVDELKSAGEFVVGRTSKELPPVPGLEITGYGQVALPVNKTTAEELTKHFDQAPLWSGEKTLIDKEVRNSWQLDPNKFEITNPTFVSGVNGIVRQVKQDLGCPQQNVTAKLYKLLLYEPGGHFKPHRDTEKHDGMFATLIVQLPSVFTGGDLVVKHGSKTKRIAFSNPDAKFLCHYAAHYSDCEHELTEITSGYRLALIYSLCWNGNGIVPTPPGLDDPGSNLVGLLGQVEASPDITKLAWGLDHHYSENSFMGKGTQALKGGDKLVASAIQNANLMLEDNKKLDLFIVEAMKLVELYGQCSLEGRRGWYKHGGNNCFEVCDELETEYEYKFITCDGQQHEMNSGFELDIEKEVLNIDYEDNEFWGECHEGECSGPSGNEGASQSNWYRRYCLVMWPKSKTMTIMCNCGLDTAMGYVKSKITKWETEQDKAEVLNELETLFEFCTTKMDQFIRYEGRVGQVLEMVTAVKELPLALKLANLLNQEYTVNSFSWNSTPPTKRNFGIPSGEIAQKLVRFIQAFGWPAVSEPLSKLLQNCPDADLGTLAQFILQCPKDVPVADLVVNMVQRVLGLTNSGTVFLQNIFQVVFVHIQLCSHNFDALLEISSLQNLTTLCDLLVFLKEKLDAKTLTNCSEFYSKIIDKFLTQMHKAAAAGKLNSPTAIAVVMKCAGIFTGLNNNSHLQRFVEAVLIQKPNTELLKKLLTVKFVKPNGGVDITTILVKARLDQLQPIVMASKPVFSWNQPQAIIEGHPEVQAFMRGPQQTYIYQNFGGIKHARNWVRKHFGKGNKTVCAIVQTSGIGVRAQAVITKAPGGHDKVLKQYADDCKEYNKLNKSLPKDEKRPDIPSSSTVAAATEAFVDLTN